jgi:hypothetical protein
MPCRGTLEQSQKDLRKRALLLYQSLMLQEQDRWIKKKGESKAGSMAGNSDKKTVEFVLYNRGRLSKYYQISYTGLD